MRRVWIGLMIAAAGAAQEPMSTAFAFAQSAKAVRTSGDERLYDRAKRAIERDRWDEALEALNELAAGNGSRADAALYWKAYVLHKTGRRDEALAAIEQLRKANPSSRWLDDAKALELEVKQASGQNVSPDAQADEDLKLMALNSLISSDPERAVPMLEKLLKSSSSIKLKERALFVLAQSNSARARELLSQIARGSGNPDMQMKAISYLAVHSRSENRQVLADVYAATNDADVKRAVLRAFMIAHDTERLAQAAKTEKSPELRMEAIRQIGNSGGQADLWQIYQAETSAEVKQEILRALFVAHDTAHMAEAARNEKDPAVKRTAIRNLGIMGKSTGNELAALYAANADQEIRKEIVNALFLQHNATALVDLARKETNPAMKREIVSRLSLIRSKEATDYLMEILNK